MTDYLERCVCSHPRGIHIGGALCTRGCRCWHGRYTASAAGYTKEERRYWERYLAAEAA